MHANNLLAYSCKPTEASESSLEWRDIALLFFFGLFTILVMMV
jgi:hypothetical protein